MSENMRKFLLALNAYEREWLKLSDMIEQHESIPDQRRQQLVIEGKKTILKLAAKEMEL